MQDIKLAYRILSKLVERTSFEPGDDPWLWALCFQFYQTFEPGMMTAATDALLSVVYEKEYLSMTTRLAALACLSKIGTDEIKDKLATFVASLPGNSEDPAQEFRSKIFDVIEGKEVTLRPRCEILHKFEEEVKDTADWLARLGALNVLHPNPELTAFLIKQKKILAGQETS